MTTISTLKLISHLYDTTQDLLIQFTTTVAVDNLLRLRAVEEMMPYLDGLVYEYGLK